METLKKLRQDPKFRQTVWTIITAGVSMLITYVSNLDYGRVPLFTLALRELMKYVNVRYFGDIGVEEETKK